jgi:hypothetical protein
VLAIIVEVVTRQLAPDPPCKQGLAVVGGRCCGALLSSWSPCTWHCSQDALHEHSRESVMGCVAVGSSSAGSTCDLPYKQLLIRLEVRAGSIFCVAGGHHVSVMWHQERGRWCLPDGCSPPPTGLPAPLPDLLSLIKNPHILFGHR